MPRGCAVSTTALVFFLIFALFLTILHKLGGLKWKFVMRKNEIVKLLCIVIVVVTDLHVFITFLSGWGERSERCNFVNVNR